MVSTLEHRRDLSLKRVNGIECDSAQQSGGGYLFPKIDGIGATWKSDRRVGHELLREPGVLVVQVLVSIRLMERTISEQSSCRKREF